MPNIERICFDAKFVSEMMPKLVDFFVKHILPFYAKNKFADICIKFSMKENINGSLGGRGLSCHFNTGILSIFHTPSMKIC